MYGPNRRHIGGIESVELSGNCYIAHLRVNEADRGAGYGSELVEHLMRQLAARCQTVQVNPAVGSEAFYEKNGFKPCGGFFNRFIHGLDRHSRYYRPLS